MRVRVALFPGLRERAGCTELTLELPDGASVGDALARLSELTEGVPVVLAVNREYAHDGDILQAGDEVALIPPVSGGSVGVGPARVTDEPRSEERRGGK